MYNLARPVSFTHFNGFEIHLSCMYQVRTFLLPSRYSIVWMHKRLLPVGEHLRCFQLLTIMNRPTASVCVHVSV